MEVKMQVQGIKEIQELFAELPKGVKQPTTWRKFWKKNIRGIFYDYNKCTKFQTFRGTTATDRRTLSN